jgi:hypothetical protein
MAHGENFRKKNKKIKGNLTNWWEINVINTKSREIKRGEVKGSGFERVVVTTTRGEKKDERKWIKSFFLLQILLCYLWFEGENPFY